MGIKARLKRLERDQGGRPWEPISTPMEVLLAQIIQEERAQAERDREAADPHLPPMEDVLVQIMREEREAHGRSPLFPVFATPIAESGDEP